MKERIEEYNMSRAISSSKSFKGRRSYESGIAAENRISADCERRGLIVSERRWRGKAGEIDLVARDGSALVFIEVKQSRTFDQAMMHLSERQVSRLYAAAEEFVANEPNGNLTEVRFDLALVNQQGEYQIIENAFA